MRRQWSDPGAPMSRAAFLIAVLAGFGLLVGCQRGLPLEPAEREMLLRAGDLVAHGYGFEDPAPYEKFDKTRYLDGSSEIAYEFETPDGEVDQPLYLNVTLTFEKNFADAMVSYGSTKTAMKYGLKATGIRVREIEGFYPYGDASEFSVLEKDGQPVGNLFATRHGNRIYLLVMSGMYFDDAEVWEELMKPRLEKFSASVKK